MRTLPQIPSKGVSNGTTEIAGVDNVARSKKQGWTTREWTTWHEEAGVDNAGVSDHEREKFYDFPIHYMFKIVACLRCN